MSAKWSCLFASDCEECDVNLQLVSAIYTRLMNIKQYNEITKASSLKLLLLLHEDFVHFFPCTQQEYSSDVILVISVWQMDRTSLAKDTAGDFYRSSA